MKQWFVIALFFIALKSMLVFFTIYDPISSAVAFDTSLNLTESTINSTYMINDDIISTETLAALRVNNFDLLSIVGAIGAFFEIICASLAITGIIMIKMGVPIIFAAIVEVLIWLTILIGIYQFFTGREVEN